MNYKDKMLAQTVAWSHGTTVTPEGDHYRTTCRACRWTRTFDFGFEAEDAAERHSTYFIARGR